MLTAFHLISGFVILCYAAHILLDASVELATSFKLSPLIIGLTIVAGGTSMPELFVSTLAALKGNADIAIGNVVGSNIANIGLILALAGLIAPHLTYSQLLVKRDGPVMILISVILTLMLIDGQLTRYEAIGLLTCFVGYLYLAFQTTPHNEVHIKVHQKKPRPRSILTMLLLASLFGLWLGSELFVTGAVALAKHLGFSDYVIGLTVVAVGTSLPELATAIAGVYKKQYDIVLGNVIGSNVFNIMFILGVTGTIIPVKSAMTSLDSIFLLGTAISLFAFMYTAKQLHRWHNFILMLGYITYVCILLRSN